MDLYVTNPGPIDESVLYDQDKHVSSAVWEGQVQTVFLLYMFHFVLFFLPCLFKLYSQYPFEEFH